MREKVKRRGVEKRPFPRMGGVRLTEYDYTMREKVFAKFGRVGEVYIPNKVDKWGRRFGFVKFLEVKNAEELNIKL
ncbi:RNA recognition motif, partial [Trifolium medium]|nr:RNA recognition motif [Trifolium medium]